MAEEDWFLFKLSALRDNYVERAKENIKALAEADKRLADEKAKHADLVRDLCRALDRAQEIIIEIGEKSGNAELLKDAKIYANIISGVSTGLGPKPFPHYSTGPKKAREKANAAAKKKPAAKRQRRAK